VPGVHDTEGLRARANETRKAAPVKKGTNNRNRNKSSRYRAKLKQKHRRARKRVTRGERKYHR